jgi:ribosomal-protein-alanine N-acetyltransferase
MTIVLRPMAELDVEAVATMEAAAQPNPWSEKIFRDELAAPDRAYLVAEDGEIIGFGGVMVVDGDAHVTNLLVAPESRRAGTGILLMAALVEASLEMGAANLTLEVRSRNEAARGLYARFGLAPVGLRKGYYGDDDALIMWAHEIAGPEYRDRIERLGAKYRALDTEARRRGARS